MFRLSQPDELSVTELEQRLPLNPIPPFAYQATLKGVSIDISLSITLETATMTIQICCATALVCGLRPCHRPPFAVPPSRFAPSQVRRCDYSSSCKCSR